MKALKKGLVLLYEDFGGAWLEVLRAAGIGLLGLHINPQQGKLEDFLAFVERERETIESFEAAGTRVEYRLHVLDHLLPRELFAAKKELFRTNEEGKRTDDYNACPSSAEALEIIEKNAEKLARVLRQNSHRYHFWPDDDLGGDIKCRCGKCRSLSAAEQNLIFCAAMLRGIRRYDKHAALSCLVYGEEEWNEAVPEGIFPEYAPFKRRHDLPLLEGKTNEKYRVRFEKLLNRYGAGECEVLEYFLSYDYEGFCRDGTRVEKDVEYYRSLGIKRLTTFAVFPEKEYIKKHGFQGIFKYATL